MYGLNDSVVNDLQKIFAQFKKVKKTFIYGSRAKGNYRKGSDIDLSFLGEDLTLDDLFKIEDAIEELNLPYMFDLSIFSQINNENLIKHINRVGKIFYEAST